MDSRVEISVAAADRQAIAHLNAEIAAGKHWYIALLEAIALWSSGSEVIDGREYRYLIEGEAFDWLVLAERLCQTVNGLLPEDEKVAMLFNSRPPLKLGTDEFKRLIGRSKYRQYLNYLYGVVVEEALVLAVQEEVRKERQPLSCKAAEHEDEAYRRIYGSDRDSLMADFRRDKGYPQSQSTSLTELKEFTYWLFKYRIKNNDKARVASDTKKALDYLRRRQADAPGLPD